MKITLLFIGICIIGIGQAYGAEGTGSNLLPEGIVIKDVYKPGIGEPIGKISAVSGQAVVLHAEPGIGYRAEKNLDLYKNDTLITLDDGQMGFTLNDGSFLSLAPRTRLQINKSVYAPGQKTRSSFMDMGFGKARFVVQKLLDAKHSEFKVKTKTSVAGVRGSDFVIYASEEITEITTLSDTVLEVVSLATPEAAPVVMNDFEQSRVEKGAAPSEARKVEAEEIERLMKEFMIQPPRMTGAAVFNPVQQTSGAGTARENDSGVTPEEGISAHPFKISGEDLIIPGPVEEPIGHAGAPVIEPMENFGLPQAQQQNEQVRDIQDQVIEKKSENEIVDQATVLPEFPGLPDLK